MKINKLIVTVVSEKWTNTALYISFSIKFLGYLRNPEMYAQYASWSMNMAEELHGCLLQNELISSRWSLLSVRKQTKTLLWLVFVGLTLLLPRKVCGFRHHPTSQTVGDRNKGKGLRTEQQNKRNCRWKKIKQKISITWLSLSPPRASVNAQNCVTK